MIFSPGCFFTDDSVQTAALADSILTGKPYSDNLKTVSRRYSNAGYGGGFAAWAFSDSVEPYNSWGNGSAVGTNPVGFAYETPDETLNRAEHYPVVTHNHPEGIKGAQAVSSCIYLAHHSASKAGIRAYVIENFHYNLSRTLSQIRPIYTFNDSCQGSVPQAITAFLESINFKDIVRKAISLGGDSDTLGCITGGIAQAACGVPSSIQKKRLPSWTSVCETSQSSLQKSSGFESPNFHQSSHSTTGWQGCHFPLTFTCISASMSLVGYSSSAERIPCSSCNLLASPGRHDCQSSSACSSLLNRQDRFAPSRSR